MKQKRQNTIKAIIEKNHIETQEDLARALKENGFVVTQATVSRDIKEMMLVKVADKNGKYHYVYPHTHSFTSAQGQMQRTLKDSIISINSNSNMVVIKTLPGAANAVAYSLDNAKHSEILGTIAGDDTVFLALQNGIDGTKFIEKLREYM